MPDPDTPDASSCVECRRRGSRRRTNDRPHHCAEPRRWTVYVEDGTTLRIDGDTLWVRRPDLYLAGYSLMPPLPPPPPRMRVVVEVDE